MDRDGDGSSPSFPSRGARGQPRPMPLGFELKISRCISVPKGHMTIAQGFNLGFARKEIKVPKGRLIRFSAPQPTLRDLVRDCRMLTQP